MGPKGLPFRLCKQLFELEFYVTENKPVSAVSKLAHEIKNPLTAIIGFTQVMSDHSRENVTVQQMRNWAEIVHESALGLSQICERVLEEEHANSSIVKIESVDFNEFGKNIVAQFQEEAKNKGVSLNLKISDNFPILQTDPVLLSQMLNNMISNAIKFTPKGGSVNVNGEVDLNSNALILVVQDTGQGIPSDILMALRRGEQVTTSSDSTKYKGWGIGMKVINENAQKLDCNFELYCPKEKGTVALLKFPM